MRDLPVQELIRSELELLTGISKNHYPPSYEIEHADIDDEDIPATPSNPDLTSDLGNLLKFNFRKDVDAGVNMAVIRRASKIVYDQQKVSIVAGHSL